MKNMDVMNISTLGELIKFHREKKEFSIDELSRKTKIRIKQLINLEENKLTELPNRAYLVGFLKTLCAELEISLDLALKLLNESNIKEGVLEFLPLGKEIKPLHFNFIEKSSNNKILLAIVLFSSFTIAAFIGVSINKDKILEFMKEKAHTNISIIGKKQLVQSDAVVPNPTVVSKELILPEETAVTKEQAIVPPPVVEEKAKPVVQQLTITAKNGSAFIAYRVDQNRLIKFFLEQGKVLELKGEQIRLDAGNPDALEFSKNGEPLAIEKKASKIHLVFPENQ